MVVPSSCIFQMQCPCCRSDLQHYKPGFFAGCSLRWTMMLLTVGNLVRSAIGFLDGGLGSLEDFICFGFLRDYFFQRVCGYIENLSDCPKWPTLNPNMKLFSFLEHLNHNSSYFLKYAPLIDKTCAIFNHCLFQEDAFFLLVQIAIFHLPLIMSF